MDDKKKIVLGSEDIITKGLQDMFINVNLQQTFNQIKKDKYDNNFDLSEQFRKERNASRNFRIYGIVDSNILDTDSFVMDIYKDSGLTQYYTAVTTTSLVYDEKNVFNKKRGKYLLELNNYDANFVYMKITGDYITYGDQVFEQQLVFHTVDGEFVEYGTETVDIGLVTPGSLEIENDFPFFYNKHWIKKDIEVVEEKKALISFQTIETNVDEGDSAKITIELDKPSPFGNEIVDLGLELVTAKLDDFNLSISGNPVNLPVTLTWSSGEQYKVFDFDGLNDDFPEFSESLLLNMSNFQLVDTGDTIVHLVNINDITPRHYANYNFGEMYRNRYSFTGRTWENFNTNIVHSNSFSILRNGLYYERRNEEFYPNDTYTLTIENKGNDTVLPINYALGISQEELFLSGVTKTFTPLSVQYSGTQTQTSTQLHKLKVIFSGSGINYSTSNFGYIDINGTQFSMNNGLNYNSAKLAFTSQNPIINAGMEEPWTYEFNDTDKTVIITSKSPGVPVDFSTREVTGPGAIPNTLPIDPTKIPIIEEIDSFVFYEQSPLTVKLAANSNANNNCLYEIVLNKSGFDGLVISPTSIPATSAGTDNFLITELDFNMRAWDDSAQDCTYNTATTTDTSSANAQTWSQTNVTANPANFVMPVGKSFINGSVLLSNNNIQGKQFNETRYTSAVFYPKKLLIEPCTNSIFNSNGVKQKVRLTFPNSQDSGSWCGNDRIPYQTNRLSFDFRTGTTGPITTFYKTGVLLNSISSNMNWNYNVQVSGATAQASPYTMVSYLQTNGPLSATSVLSSGHIVEVESKIPGVPFQITNLIPNYYHTAYPGSSWPSPSCPPVSAGTVTHKIEVQELIPNGIPGTGLNPANNRMGGFNTILQFVP